MFGAILKATNSSFQKGMTFCLSIYVKKVMTLLAFIFEQPSYAFILIRSSLGLLHVIFRTFVPELWPLIYTKIWYPLNILRTN